MALRIRGNLLESTCSSADLIRNLQAMFDPPPGYRLLISPDRISEEQLKRDHIGKRPTTIWREGEYWRVCRWCTGHEAFELIRQGWEVFDDWETGDD